MGVSFDEVQFPTNISAGATGGPRFSTSVTPLSSGYENRNRNWLNRRGEWDVSTGLQTQEQAEALIDFFSARAGRWIGFRFKDWLDYRCPRWRTTPGDMSAYPIPTWFTTNGSTNSFQIFKPQGDTLRTYNRLIQKPVLGTLGVRDNGVLMTESVDFTCDYTTGIITLSSGRSSTTGHAISGYCEFDTPARFDTDDLKIVMTTTEIFKGGPIPVVEIRDIS